MRAVFKKLGKLVEDGGALEGVSIDEGGCGVGDASEDVIIENDELDTILLLRLAVLAGGRVSDGGGDMMWMSRCEGHGGSIHGG